jgi:hypothetical protein
MVFAVRILHKEIGSRDLEAFSVLGRRFLDKFLTDIYGC